MRETDLDAKEKIIKTAVNILNEVDDIDTITIRQIAERAGVGVGLINYHFQSKENLLHKAVALIIDEIALKRQKTEKAPILDPLERLKAMVAEVSDFAVKHSKFHRIVVSYELQNGTFQAPLRYIPILREIYGDIKDEVQLRLIALQLLAAMQVVQLRPHEFKLYSGIDVNDKTQRDKFINTLIDNLIYKK